MGTTTLDLHLNDLEKFSVRRTEKNAGSNLFQQGHDVIKLFNFISPLKTLSIKALKKQADSIIDSSSSLLMPKTIVEDGNNIVGTITELKPGKNLSALLQDSSIHELAKLNCINKLFDSLQLFMNEREEKGFNIYLTGINENNVIIDENGKVILSGIDQSRTLDKGIAKSIYISNNNVAQSIHNKYITGPNQEVYSTKNTEIYEAVMTYMSYLLKTDASRISIKEFEKLVNYYKYLGFNNKFIEILNSLYDSNDNVFDPDAFTIPAKTYAEDLTYDRFVHKRIY